MSLGYYFLLPVIFSFLTPLFKKFGEFGLRGSSILLNAILFIQALQYTKMALPQIAQFSVAPPLGIAFILDNFSLLFLIIFTKAKKNLLVVICLMIYAFQLYESKLGLTMIGKKLLQ